MTDQTPDHVLEAADRVRAFLDTRARMGGPIDHTVIHSLGHRETTVELLTADLRELVGSGPTEPSSTIGTRSPSVQVPHDAALRGLVAAAAHAHANGVRTADLFRAVLAGASGEHLGGQRHTLEGHVFAAIADSEPSPLEGMILQRGQAYADRADYAVLSVTRNDDHTVDVQVVP